MALRSHRERRQAALDVLAGMTGKAERGEKMAAWLEDEMGALGSFAIDFAMGDIWSRPGLSKRDRSLASLSSLVCQGRERELQFHTRAGLNHGLSREEIVELITHLCAYAGFPTAINAMRIVNGVFTELDGGTKSSPREPAPRVDDAERSRVGLGVFRTLSGRDLTDQAGEDLEETFDVLTKYAMEWAFGEIWSRPHLSRRDRSLVVVAALTTMGKPAELEIHIPGALNHGVTETELTELLAHMIPYTGFPAMVEAFRIWRRTLKARAAEKS